jgi:hypothetical protein
MGECMSMEKMVEARKLEAAEEKLKRGRTLIPSVSNVLITFQCPEADCGDFCNVGISFLVESGTPMCDKCDVEMELWTALVND